jgi:hypothetical protein
MSQSKETPKDLTEPQPIPIDGFQQVLEMLKIADPHFRESLLRRLALKDQRLAHTLRRDLEGNGHYE